MDHLSFVFSLLLIVSVTTSTFGSVIKAKNPNEESLVDSQSDPDLFPNMAPKELEALLKRSRHQSNPADMKTDAQAKLEEQNDLNEQESEMFEQDDPVPELIPEDYQIAICINNESGDTWRRVSGLYFVDNSTEPAFRDSISVGESALASSYGKKGVGGVLEYHINTVESPLAVMYRVDDHHKSWSVKLNKDETPIDKDLYDDMVLDSYEATDHWSSNGTPLTESLMYRVRMSNSFRATLEMQIYKVDGSGM